MITDIRSLNCDLCPARHLRDRQLGQIAKWEKMRLEAYESLAPVQLYLLGESIPASRFFYDRSTDYPADGLRFYLREELVGQGTEDELFAFLRSRRVLLVDCAICPLHKLTEIGDQILAATICLRRNTIGWLELNPEAPIITLFPKGRGISKRDFPGLEKRVVGQYQFSELSGLRPQILTILKKSEEKGAALQMMEQIRAFGTVFHSTCRENLDSIMRDGLIPQQSTFNRGGEDEPCEITCLSISNNRGYWHSALRDKCEGAEVVTLEIDATVVSELKCDLDYSNFTTRSAVERYKTSEFSKIVSITGDFACLERIPPRAIKEVKG